MARIGCVGTSVLPASRNTCQKNISAVSNSCYTNIDASPVQKVKPRFKDITSDILLIFCCLEWAAIYENFHGEIHVG